LLLVYVVINSVLNALVIAIEMMEMVPDVIEALQVNGCPLSLCQQLLLVVVDHTAQLLGPRAVPGQLLIIRDRWLSCLHSAS